MRNRTAVFTLAVLATAPLAAHAQPAGYERRFVGRVVTFQPYNLQLDRGPHIYLHNGTVLRPRGLNLRNGMHVLVIGHDDANGSFQADQIDLLVRRPQFPPPPPPF